MKGLFTLDDLKNNNIRKDNGEGVSGIYLWGVKNNLNYIPLCIGAGVNIHMSLFESLCSWRGGQFRVPHWEDIIGVKNNKENVAKNKNLLYIPDGLNKYKFFISNSEVQKTIKNVFDNFYCCWEILPKSSKTNEEKDAFATLVGTKLLISSHSFKVETTFSRRFYEDYLKESSKQCP